MGRRALHSPAALIEAAVGLAAAGGPGAVTMQGLAATTGATNGTIYHRFESRQHLLATVWLDVVERFQRDWWQVAETQSDPGELAVTPVRWARDNRAAATVLALHRVEEFLDDGTSEPLGALRSVHARAAEVRRAGRGCWTLLATRFLGEATAATVERSVFALATVPLAALRHPLASGGPIPASAEALVRETAVALLGGPR